jgi:hypothetical protein
MNTQKIAVLSGTRTVENRFGSRRTKFEHSVKNVDGEPDLRCLRFDVSCPFGRPE